MNKMGLPIRNELTSTIFRVPYEEIEYFLELDNELEHKLESPEYVIKLYGSFCNHLHYLDFLRDIKFMEILLPDMARKRPTSLEESLNRVIVD
jgi:hypothetical protein